MNSKTEYQIAYTSGRVIKVELDGTLIQIFDYRSDCTLRKKTKLLLIREVIDLLPEEA